MLHRGFPCFGLLVVFAILIPSPVHAAATLDRYYAHPAVQDACGVIAPWYSGQNGAFDERVRIAVDVYRRYPWAGTDKAVLAAPEFVYSSFWRIDASGEITIPPTSDWMCGDLSQRGWSLIRGLSAYYRYSGDPVAFLYITRCADYILGYAQTDEKADWPRFPIATPTKGKAYGQCRPDGRNQVDLCAMLGTEMLRAYRLTGDARCRQAAEHWGDVLAAKCAPAPGCSPWNRYVDPAAADWSDELTGSITMILDFLCELERLGYTGKDGAITRARQAGDAFVNDVLLPRWADNDTWGRYYWDWDNPVICGNVFTCMDYLLAHAEAFPKWKSDVGRVLPLILARDGADPRSMGEVYSGAWAFPESSSCCGTSLSYLQYTGGPTFMRYGELADDPWAREIGRRMMVQATYDAEENGIVKDGLLGETVVTGAWYNLAHPWPLLKSLEAMAELPDRFGPARENHIMRSTSVVNHVVYDDGRIEYTTFDAPERTIDVLRLAFRPTRVSAGGERLARRDDLLATGYTERALPCGDWIVSLRHDGARSVVVEGDDPQRVLEDSKLAYGGEWKVEKDAAARGGSLHVASASGAEMRASFSGNQVRLVAHTDGRGGRADVYLDGARQPTLLDFWSATPMHRQILYAKGGLALGRHELRIVARGQGNPIASGTRVYVDAVQYSEAAGHQDCGTGLGPTGAQRMIFGYLGRNDYVDSRGFAWKPAAEFVVRTGYNTDVFEKAAWTRRRTMTVGGTEDSELYRYGVHGEEIVVNLTVGPATYDLTLKFAETPQSMERGRDRKRLSHAFSIEVNGERVVSKMNVAEAAGGLFRAHDLFYPGITPRNGVIEVRLKGEGESEAMLSALELAPAGRP